MDLQITKVKKDAQTFITLGGHLKEKAANLSITKIEDTQIAALLLKDCQVTEKEIEAKRQEIVKLPNDFLREVNLLFKDVVAPALEAKAVVKTKLLAFDEEQKRIAWAAELKRQEEERARLKKLEDERRARELEEQKRIDAENARLAEISKAQSAERAALEKERMDLERAKREAEEERLRIVEEKKEELRKQIAENERIAKESEMKVKGVMKRWTWEVADELAIPRAFCSPDSVKINRAIKEGIREIAGIRIYEASDVR